MELYLDPVFKKKNRYKIIWTEEMLKILSEKFATTYNKVLAKELNVSWRSLIRKARELGLEKEPNFLDKNRSEISKMAVKAHPPHPFKGVKGWSVPNSENTRFEKGCLSNMHDPEIVKKVHEKRNKTIKTERIRIRYGLPRKTKLKLNF